MTSLLHDIRTSAQWIAVALSSSGYQAIFTPGSLREVERFMGEHSEYGIAVPGGLLAADLGPRLFALGAYVGESIWQHLGGTWVTEGDGSKAEIGIALRPSDGSTIWPVQRVIKRLLPASGIAQPGRSPRNTAPET